MEPNGNSIAGYRVLTQFEIDSINDVKHVAQVVDDVITSLEGIGETDKRWVAIAKTQLQQGFMAAVRSIARPTGF
jgi:hypothetical protein